MKRVLVHAMLWSVALALTACGGGDDGGGGGGLQTEKLPEIEATPVSLTFDPIPPGQTQTIQLEIQNVGAGDDLVIYDVYLQDSGAPFTFTGPALDTLATGVNDTIAVTYAPVSLLTAPTALVIDSNAATKPLLTVPIKVAAAGEDLVIAPNPVNFGDVLGGQTRIETVTLTNLSKDVEIANIFIDVGSSLDFSITYKPALPAVLGALSSLTTDVAYTPTGFDGDDGFLVVAIKEEGTQSLVKVPMHGQEVGPEINVTPPKIDLGWVAKGDTAAADVMIYNMGQHDLIVQDLFFSVPGNEDLAVAEAPELPFTVEPGASQKVVVAWTPQAFFPPTTDPIGGFVVKSNDADEALVNVPVYGNIDAPSIQVIPADQVNFGIVAQGWDIHRTLTIENVGHAPLTIFSLEVLENTPAGEFSMTPDDAFPPTAGTGEGQVFMNTDEQDNGVDVDLAFTNDGGATGDEAAVLKIISDDPLTPEILVDLVAKRGGAPECTVTFAPSKLNFGVVAHGATKTMAINVVNSGSGFCSWKSGKVSECTSFMGMMNTCMEGAGPSPNYLPQGMPIPMQDGMAPGTAQPIQILYKPPATIPWIPMF
ncbi:MAG: choice-of-anchor D domain-containing protein, partial [Deltaproteobacteria bacterium]|nr:choice-of-anchor D domain-containing protein [Deltaproteobacteria bacterium]